MIWLVLILISYLVIGSGIAYAKYIREDIPCEDCKFAVGLFVFSPLMCHVDYSFNCGTVQNG